MLYLNFQTGWLVLKSSGGERAWFLAEGSEPRNKLILLAGKNQRAEEPACLMKVWSTDHI
jgi:hypothetical protein